MIRNSHRARWPLLVLVALTLIALSSSEYSSEGITSFTDVPESWRKLTPYPRIFRPPQAPAPSHTYQPDGLLVVQDGALHPILELIERAEQEWETKQKQASTTLEEAVAEYQRRYKRAPPKGFDEWWKYAQEHNVLLPDEYDSIMRGLEPFWGISPADLLDAQVTQENKPDAYTLGKLESGAVGVVHTASASTDPEKLQRLVRGSSEIMDLLKPIEHLLPPFRATFSPHDNPNLVSDYHIKQAALEAASQQRHVDLSSLPQPAKLGYASACSPDSPGGRLAPLDHTNQHPPRSERTFIHNHLLSMDPCLHPDHFFHHAQLMSRSPTHPPAQPLLTALFTFCSTLVHHNLLPPSFISWVDDLKPRENDPPWAEKTDERLLWRGSNTGMNHDADERWRNAQRQRLVQFGMERNGTARIMLSNLDSVAFDEVEVSKAHLNPALLDIVFTGKPLGCAPETCKFLETEFEFRKQLPGHSREVGEHKYMIDVDGNGWSSRFKRLVTSNALIFKSTIYPEWWLDRIQPWVHYVPIQVDYSDLYDALVFFRGGLYGEGSHPALAAKIAAAGREWSLTYWRKEDMTAYFFRLLLEYSRVMSLDREAMSYKASE
ncbi:hypothetical protein HGRIS_000143 [Hohenbuehelia grisea]|uniref:Glycosyl transferase CAP10 domain-containing protein n=2 Tax=Hohenbuehelia grisea TaxID=104357 RepID=A0ABR3JQ60_9AGAR